MAGTAVAAPAAAGARLAEEEGPEEPLFKLGSRRDAASDEEGSDEDEEGEIAAVSAQPEQAAADHASEDGFHSAGEDGEQDVPDWGEAPAADGSEEGEVLEVELQPAPPRQREPFDVPTAGPYFQHDDRFEGDADEEIAKILAAQKAKAAQPVKKWGHDLFEEVQRRIEQGIPGPVRSGGESGGRPRGRGRGGRRNNHNSYSNSTGDPLADDHYYHDQQANQEHLRGTFQEVGQQFQQYRAQQGGGRGGGVRRGRGGRGGRGRDGGGYRDGGYGQQGTQLKADAASFQPRDSYPAGPHGHQQQQQQQQQEDGGWGEAPGQQQQQQDNGWEAGQGGSSGSYAAASPYELEGHMATLSVGQQEGQGAAAAAAAAQPAKGGGRRYSAMAGALA